MCYSVPAKIVKLMNDEAVVDYGGVQKTVNLSLLDSPKIGDFILIHAGFGIEKLDSKSAEESLKLIKEQIKISEGLLTRQKR